MIQYGIAELQSNRFQTTIAPKTEDLLGLRMGALVRAIYDTHSVRTKPEINLGGFGASHDPVGGVYTCLGFNFAPKTEDLLWEIDHYHSDVSVYSLFVQGLQNCI